MLFRSGGGGDGGDAAGGAGGAMHVRTRSAAVTCMRGRYLALRGTGSAKTPRRDGLAVPPREIVRGLPVQTAAAIFSAFLRASSRVPTYMNALSGRASPSPLQMRSKLSIVSSRLVVTPGRPVNTSPT